jgi:hypothetical protein
MGNPNDPLGILNSTGGDDPLGILKKKDGGSASTSGVKPSSPKGINDLKGSDAPAYFKQQQQAYNKAQMPEVDDDPVGNAVRPLAQRKRELAEQARRSESTYHPESFKARTEEIKILKEQEEALTKLPVASTAEARGIVQTYVRKQDPNAPDINGLSVQQVEKLLPSGNITAKLAFDQYARQRNIQEAMVSAGEDGRLIKDPRKLGRELIRLTNPKLDETLKGYESGGSFELNNYGEGYKTVLEKTGLNAVKDFLDKNPDLPNHATLKEDYNNWVKDYKIRNTEETAAAIREKIGQKLYDKRGFGASIYRDHNPSQEEIAEAFNELQKEGAFDEQDVQVFKEYVQPMEKRNIGTDIPMSGFVNKLGEGVAGGAKGTINVFRGDDERRMEQSTEMFDTRYKGVKNRAWYDQFLDGVGDMTGQVAWMAVGAKGLGGMGKLAGLGKLAQSETANLWVNSFLTAYDSHAKEALEALPNDDDYAARKLYAFFMTGMEAASEGIFKDTKVLDAFKKSMTHDVAALAKGVSSGYLSKQAANSQFKKILSEKLAPFAQNFAKESFKNATEEAIIDPAQAIADAVIAGKEVNEYDVAKKSVGTFATTALYSPIVAAAAALKDSRKSTLEKSIYEMASNPEMYAKQIATQAKADPNFPAQVAQSNLEHASKVVKDLEKTDLTTRQKEKYLLHSLHEKVLQDELDNTTDSNLQDRIKEQIKITKEAKEKLLITRAEQIAAKEEKQADENQETQTEVPQVESVPTESVQVEQQQEAAPVAESIESTNETTENNQQEVAQQEATEIQSSEAQEVVQDTNIEPQNQINNEREEEGLLTEAIEQGAAETVVPEAVSEPISEEGNFKKKKILTERAYEAEKRPEVKKYLEQKGLYRESFSPGQRSQQAAEFIQQFGEEDAFAAVDNFDVRGGMATSILAKLRKSANRQMAALEATDTEQLDALSKRVADIDALAEREGYFGGEYIGQLGHEYKDSELGYNSETLSKKWKEKYGEDPTEEQVKRWRKNDKIYAELSQKIEEAEKRAADAEQKAKELAEKFLIDDLKEDAAKKDQPTRESKQYAEKALNAIGKVRAKIKANSYSDATGMVALVDTGLAVIESAIKGGMHITAAIEKGIKHIKSKLKEQGIDAWEKEDAFRQDVTQAFTEAGIVPDKAEMKKGRLHIPKTLIRNLVEDGVNDIEELTQIIHGIVKADFPEVTHRQVRDGISDYGKTIEPNPDVIAGQIRKMRRIGRAISGLEDIAEKKRPLRSGLQRDKLDADERKWQKELREAMKELPMDEETEAKELKTAVDAAKQRLKNHIEDLQRQIDTGEKVERSKRALPEDDELKQLREQKDGLKKKYDEIFGNEELSDEQRLQNAIKSVESSIKEFQRRIDEKDFEAKKRKELPQSDALDAAKKNRDSLKEMLRKMQEDAGVIEQKRLESTKKRINKRMEEMQRIMDTWDFAKKEPKPLKPDAELIKLRAEKIRMDEEYEKEFYKYELSKRKLPEIIKDWGWETWGIFRVFNATFDASFALVQGGTMTFSYLLRKPKVVVEAFVNSAKFFASVSKPEVWMREEVKAQDWYPIARDAKLAITLPSAELTAREEVFFNGWANLIWDKVVSNALSLGYKPAHDWLNRKNPVNAFERAAVGYLDTYRVARFKEGMKMLEMKRDLALREGIEIEITKQDYKDVADVVNTFTGRASLGKLEQHSKVLARVIYSPRNWASLLKMTPPYGFFYFSRLSPTARKMYLLDLSRAVGFTVTLVAAAAAYYNNDDDPETGVELDPRSSDFGKIRIGPIRVDSWGGKVQQISFLTRFILGVFGGLWDVGAYKRKTGEVLPLGVRNKTPNIADMSINMATNKSAPTFAMAYKFARTEMKKKNGEWVRYSTMGDDMGEPYSIGKEALDKITPMYWSTAKDLLKDDPHALDGFLSFVAFFGWSVNVYDNEKKKGSSQVTWK